MSQYLVTFYMTSIETGCSNQFSFIVSCNSEDEALGKGLKNFLHIFSGSAHLIDKVETLSIS